jgi:hypothetical protein
VVQELEKFPSLSEARIIIRSMGIGNFDLWSAYHLLITELISIRYRGYESKLLGHRYLQSTKIDNPWNAVG